MQFLQTQGPVARREFRVSLRFCAPKMLCPVQGVTPVMGAGADSPCQGEMARRARGGRVGDYEHEVLIGAVPGGVLFNLPCLQAKPSTAGSPGRGGARERAQFSPSGGNGDKRTLRRRAAMDKGTRRPHCARRRVSERNRRKAEALSAEMAAKSSCKKRAVTKGKL